MENRKMNRLGWFWIGVALAVVWMGGGMGGQPVLSFCEDFEAIDGFPSADWSYHTLEFSNLVPGIDLTHGHPGRCYVPGGAGNGRNTEIFHNQFLADYANGLEMTCDFYFLNTNFHYSDLWMGLSRLPIVNGESIAYSVQMAFNASEGLCSVACFLDSANPEHFEQYWSPYGTFEPGRWYTARIVIHPDQHVSFFVDSTLLYTTTKTIDPTVNFSRAVLGGFNSRPVYADNFCCDNAIDKSLATQLVMPASHYYEGDPFYLVSNIYPLKMDSVDARLFVMLDYHGAKYFWPTWNFFEWEDLWDADKNEWSVQVSVEEETQVIIFEQFSFPFFPFTQTGLLFYSTLTDPDVTTLFSNTEIIEWGFGGE
ncbi:hypothetical protein JXA80_05945 [bacterium]|nr:hypothetical protein [candidate division CSSED10-310 bacterium]